MLSHTAADDCRVAVDAGDPRGPPVDPRVFGTFGEHLYSSRNAKNTLEAGVLHNPTFGSWKFQVRSPTVDGGRPATHDPETVAERVEAYAERHDYPDADRMLAAYRDGTALWWLQVGDATTSPDVGRAGDRAQRVETGDGGDGLAQWCYLPLHRTRGFELEVAARAVDGATLRLAVHRVTGATLGPPLAAGEVDVGDEWTTERVPVALPPDVDDDPDAMYAVSVTTAGPANVVLDHVRCDPADHVGGADPAVVALLRDAEVPLFRWPGGNFASGYDWRDGVGPLAERPTRPNPAWDGLETNFFGTAEFLALCETVGCEPMLVVNAGDGSADDAAAWVEYCNGDTDTEYGALRAAHGHPEPWGVTHWEVGNEVYGEWQTTWSTTGGYADRYRRFYREMTAVDPTIEVTACGNRLTDWNDPLLERCPGAVDYLADHVLVGGTLDADADPADVFGAYMGHASGVFDEYDALVEHMADAGVPDPRVAVTELQLFATPGDDGPDWTDLPRSDTVGEALYTATFVHEAVRSRGRVPVVTHSGAGNHGGGLRTERERVRPDPVLHYHALGAALHGGTPLPVDLACPTYDTAGTYGADTGPEFGRIDPLADVPVLDPLAVRDGDALHVDLVHRDPAPVEREVTVAVEGFEPAPAATVTTLSGDGFTAANTLEEPDAVAPETDTAPVRDGEVPVAVPPQAFVRVTVERAG